MIAYAPSGTAVSTPYRLQRFLFLALDPVHIGTGGYRLGRVDMSIVREPGTNVPKVPGTSLSGAARSYSALEYAKPEAAGQHIELRKRSTREQRDRCPIIYTYGTATDTGGGQAGTVSISDARILLFPVPSLAGPLWVSTAETLREAGFAVQGGSVGDDTLVTTLASAPPRLNLGWLLCDNVQSGTVTPPANCQVGEVWNTIAERIVLASPKIFSQVVNSNLEIRTSVSINPETGAAQEGALFTYEAIPRMTLLWSDVVVDDYRRDENGNSRFPNTDKQFKRVRSQDGEEGNSLGEDNAGEPLSEPWNSPLDVVRAGINLMEYLGVGGMGTRGFGRISRLVDWELG